MNRLVLSIMHDGMVVSSAVNAKNITVILVLVMIIIGTVIGIIRITYKDDTNDRKHKHLTDTENKHNN